MDTGFELTLRTQEALLFAELVAWSQGHGQIEPNDLLSALHLQKQSIASDLKKKIKDELRIAKCNYPTELFYHHVMGKSNLTLNYKKIPLSGETQKILRDANVFALEFCEDGAINTGYLYLVCLLRDPRFISLFQSEELKDITIEECTLKWLEYCSALYLKDKECGDDMTLINIRIFKWLRDGNMTDEILRTAGLTQQSNYSAMPYTIFGTIEDDYKGNYAEKIPPLKSGIRDKVRRDLDVMYSFVSAVNMPEAESDLLGIYMINQVDYILFFEDGFACSQALDPVLLTYNSVKQIDVEDSSFIISFDSGQAIELDIPGITEEMPDSYNLYQFIDSMKKPQDIFEIRSDLDLISFFKRQTEHLDIYDRLIWKLENDMSLHGMEPDENHIVHFRFLALLYTQPFQSARFLRN